jgi:hypothetical protein
MKRQVHDFLPDTMYKFLETDVGMTKFQQDCFIVLPILVWITSRREKLNCQYEQFLANDKDEQARLVRLARFLRNQITRVVDIQRDVNSQIVMAMKLAKDFAESDQGWYEYLESQPQSMLTSDEEIHKARRLADIRDHKLKMNFERFIWEIEDYKIDLGSDCKIDGFLKAYEHETDSRLWHDFEWDLAALTAYRERMSCFKGFLDHYESNRSDVSLWLMYPEHCAYSAPNGNKIMPNTVVSMFTSTNLLKSIYRFEKQVQEKGLRVVIDTEKYRFLKEHWPIPSTEAWPTTIAALAVITSELVEPGWSFDTGRLQYSNLFHNHSATEPDENPNGRLGLGGKSWFFWKIDRDRFSWSISVDENLLPCHRKSNQELDDAVQSFFCQEAERNPPHTSQLVCGDQCAVLPAPSGNSTE